MKPSSIYRHPFFPPLLLAVLVPLVLFGPGLFDFSQAYLFRDLRDDLLGYRAYWADSLRSGGGLPFWNHRAFGGTPFLANPGTGSFDPFNAIYLFVSPANYANANAIYLAAHFAVLALSSYWLFRELKLKGIEVLTFAAAFSLSGLAVSTHNVVPLLGMIAVLPLYVGFLRRVFLEGRAKDIALLSLVSVFPFFKADAQSTYLMVLGGMLVLLVRTKDPFPKRVLKAFGFGISVGAASAVLLLPAWEVASAATRVREGFGQNASAWSFHPGRLAEFVFPFYFGRLMPEISFWKPSLLNGPGFYLMTPYLGSLVLLCGGATLLRPRRGTWILLVVGLIFLLTACGSFSIIPIYSFLERLLPLWSGFRYPERLLPWLSAPLLLLAAEGYRVLERGRRAENGYLLSWMAVGILCAALAATGNWPWGPIDYVRGPVLHGGLFFALSAGLLLARNKKRITGMTFSLLLAAVTLADLGLVSRTMPWASAKEVADPDTYIVVKEIQRDTSSRVDALKAGDANRVYSQGLQTEHSQEFLRKLGMGRLPPVELMSLQLWESMADNIPSYFVMDNAWGSDALLEQYRLNIFSRLSAQKRDAFLRALSVRYDLQRGMEGQAEVRLKESSLPYLYVADRILLAADPEQALSRVAGEAFQGGLPVVIEQGALGGREIVGASAPVRILRRTGSGLQAEVDGKAGVLVWNTGYDRHWAAYADDVAVPVVRANAWATAALLPSTGSNRTLVTFRYENPYFTWGALISLSALFCLCLTVIGWTGVPRPRAPRKRATRAQEG